MDPADIIAQVLHDVWQPVEGMEQFPSRWSQASAVLLALEEAGFALVQVEGLGTLLERFEARLRGRPSWSDDYDNLAAFALKVLRPGAEK